MLRIEKRLNKLLFTRNDQRAFLEDVSNLIKDGVPAPQSIATVQEISKGPTKEAAKDILQSISEGQRISESFAYWFPPSIVEVIRSGEEGGVLPETMKTAVDFLNQRDSALSSLLSSLMYPLTVFIMGCIVSVFLRHSVFENFAAIKPVNLWPQNGQILMHFSLFMEDWWWLVLIIALAIFFAVRQILTTTTGDIRRIIDNIPMLRLYRDFAAARFMETLGLLLTNHVGFKNALTILQRNATRYLAWHIYLMQFRLSGGRENIAEVLDTGLVNRADMLRLQVMAKGKGFDKALIHLGSQALERNTKNIKAAGKIFGGILLGLDAALLIFMIFSVYDVGSFIGT